jgi:hypothetical protein
MRGLQGRARASAGIGIAETRCWREERVSDRRAREPRFDVDEKPRPMRSDAADCRRTNALAQSAFVGEHDRLDAVSNTQLGDDPRDVGFDGRLPDHELRRDLSVG